MFCGGLVAARFLSLVAHFVITITIFWAKDTNVLACLPLEYTKTEYDSKHIELIAGLSVTIAFLVLEFGGFIVGVSTFNSTAAMLSIVAHASAAISLSIFVTDSWDCDKFWYIFGFCSVLPALIESCLLIGFLVQECRKN